MEMDLPTRLEAEGQDQGAVKLASQEITFLGEQTPPSHCVHTAPSPWHERPPGALLLFIRT